jgi:hypothetical protein
VTGRLLAMLAVLPLFAGCAAPPAEPPATRDNPTNPNAAEAPLPPPSASLIGDSPPGMQPATDPADPMPMPGADSGTKGMDMNGMDMKGVDMKQGDGAMPGVRPGSTSRRSR